MAESKSIRPITVRGRARWTQGNVTHLSRPPAQEASAKPLDQYRQNIWDSFPHLRTPARVDTAAVKALVERRQECLAIMKASIGDAPAFSSASREEAELAALIRRRRREGGAA